MRLYTVWRACEHTNTYHHIIDKAKFSSWHNNRKCDHNKTHCVNIYGEWTMKVESIWWQCLRRSIEQRTPITTKVLWTSGGAAPNIDSATRTTLTVRNGLRCSSNDNRAVRHSRRRMVKNTRTTMIDHTVALQHLSYVEPTERDRRLREQATKHTRTQSVGGEMTILQTKQSCESMHTLCKMKRRYRQMTPTKRPEQTTSTTSAQTKL